VVLPLCKEQSILPGNIVNLFIVLTDSPRQLRNQQSRWYTNSLSAIWTIATVCWTASLTSCYRSCKSSRRLECSRKCVTGTIGSSIHITPVLRELHLMPVHQRRPIRFNLVNNDDLVGIQMLEWVGASESG